MSSLNKTAAEVRGNYRTFYWAFFLDPLIAGGSALYII